MEAVDHRDYVVTVNLANLLLDKGAIVNAKDKDDWTPLFWAANNGQLDTARSLLDRGADMNAKSSRGGTALMLAVKGGYTDLARLIVQRGAHVHEKNLQRKAALDLARETLEGTTRTEIVGILQRAPH
jgi:uncharacterized protein